MSEPRRHHLVPQFLLRRFARRDKIVMVPRGGGQTITTSLKNAAVQTDFYTVEQDDGSRSYEVERILSMLEAQAAAALKRIDGGIFPPSDEDREHLSFFMSFQMLRGEDSRALQSEMYTETVRLLMRVAPSEFIKNAYTTNGQEPSPEEVEQLKSKLSGSQKII